MPGTPDNLDTLPDLQRIAEAQSVSLHSFGESLAGRARSTRKMVGQVLARTDVDPRVADDTAGDLHRQMVRAADVLTAAAQELHTLSEVCAQTQELLGATSPRM
jgi:mevalonate kinase